MSGKKKIIFIIAFLIASILGVVYYGIYASYHNLTVNEFTLQSDKISVPVSLVVLADLHDHCFGEDNQELVERTLGQEPDAILMVGDFINKDSSDHEEFLSLVEQLSGQVPVYFA